MPPTTKAPKRTADRSEFAFQRLQQAILTGELKAGDRVRESRLAREWDMGVTPLREAVRRMAALGYLILRPNHAPVVRQLGPDDIREIYLLRELLECFALRRGWSTIRRADLRRLDALVAKADAAPTGQKRLQARLALDTELHRLWVSPQKTPWLASIMERLQAYRPNLVRVLADHLDLVEEAFDEHRRILGALKKRELARAVELLGHHIRKSGSVLADLIESAGARQHAPPPRPRPAPAAGRSKARSRRR